MIQFLPIVQIAVASASAVLPHRVGVQPTPIFDEQEDLLSAIQVRSTITARVGSEWRVQADGVSAIPVARQSDGFSHYHYLLTYQDTPWLKPFGLTFTYGQMQRLVKAFQDLGFDFNWSDYPASRTDAFQGTHTKDIFVFQVARADCQKICTKTVLQMASILIYLAAICKTALPIFVFAV